MGSLEISFLEALHGSTPRHWGETVGTATAEVIRTILASKPHPEMGYRACLGILRRAKTYSDQRLQAASQRALQLQACSYSSLRSILKHPLDRQATLAIEPGKPGPQHENLLPRAKDDLEVQLRTVQSKEGIEMRKSLIGLARFAVYIVLLTGSFIAVKSLKNIETRGALYLVSTLAVL
jgi:hypothetical protein